MADMSAATPDDFLPVNGLYGLPFAQVEIRRTGGGGGTVVFDDYVDGIGCARNATMNDTLAYTGTLLSESSR